MRLFTHCLLALGLLAAGAAALAQAQPQGPQGIYTCVDAKGRRQTADRPIMDCLDREQKVLGTGGTVRSTLGPSLTAAERAVEEDKARQRQEEQLRLLEEKRRDRSLLTRYPDEGRHREERAAALSRVDDAIATGRQRLAELQDDRRKVQELLARPGNDAALRARLQREQTQNEQDEAAQKRLLASQAEERRRIDSRFDDELKRLRPLWSQAASISRPASSAAAR